MDGSHYLRTQFYFQESKEDLLIFLKFDPTKSKSFMGSDKFEIKKAKDMPVRLSDVKGIDEIKEELENLIKMVKEPERYH